MGAPVHIGILMSDPNAQAVYRIGAVAQLTGLSANTIRTWERRHHAVEPERSPGGGRRYRDGDIERLLLLKALCERGESISAIAGLSTEELSARRQPASSSPAARVAASPVRVAVLHRSLGASLLEHPVRGWRMDVVTEAVDELPIGPDEPIDLLILDLSLLGDEPTATYERCVEGLSPAVVIVTYDFAPQAVLEALADAGARLVRGPVDGGLLERFVREQLTAATSIPTHRTEPPSPRYDDQQLARLRGMRSMVDCECPHHLARIVETLIAFERYSASCEHKSGEEAALHRSLRLGTARARVEMEELLDQILRWERITL